MVVEIALLKNELSNKELKNHLITTQLQNEIAVSQNIKAEGDQLATVASLELEELKKNSATMVCLIINM